MGFFSDAYNAGLKGQFTDLPHPRVDLSGRTVIVTGANSGLGKEVATKLAAMNPRKLIIAVRTVAKGDTARNEILAESPGLSKDVINVWPLDMCSFKSVKEFATRCDAELGRLDVVVLNAGIVAPRFELTGDGWESTVQTNCLSTYYLALLLLPLIRHTSDKYYPRGVQPRPQSLAHPHITIVSSGLHFVSRVSPETSFPNILQAMNDPKNFNALRRYEATKLMEVFFVRALSRELEKVDDRIIVNTTNPGFCHSNLQQDSKAVERALIAVSRAALARTTEMGARAITWASILGAERGAYSTSCTDSYASPFVRSPKGMEIEKRCWDEAVEVLQRLDTSVLTSLSAK